MKKIMVLYLCFVFNNLIVFGQTNYTKDFYEKLKINTNLKTITYDFGKDEVKYIGNYSDSKDIFSIYKVVRTVKGIESDKKKSFLHFYHPIKRIVIEFEFDMPNQLPDSMVNNSFIYKINNKTIEDKEFQFNDKVFCIKYSNECFEGYMYRVK